MEKAYSLEYQAPSTRSRRLNTQKSSWKWNSKSKKKSKMFRDNSQWGNQTMTWEYRHKAYSIKKYFKFLILHLTKIINKRCSNHFNYEKEDKIRGNLEKKHWEILLNKMCLREHFFYFLSLYLSFKTYWKKEKKS